MANKERRFGGMGAFSLSRTNLTRTEAEQLSRRIKEDHPEWATRIFKEKNGKYSVYHRGWKTTSKKRQEEAYRQNRASVEKLNKAFRRDLPPWAD